NQERGGLFGGLRVPFDLNMLVLALVAVAGFFACVEVVEAVTQQASVLQRMVVELLEGRRNVPAPLPPVAWLLTAGIFVVFWTFFSTAINRIAAMKIAREETLDLKEATRFAARKFVPVLSSVLFVI